MKRKLTKVLTLALAALLLLGSASAVSASEVTSSAPHYIHVQLKYDKDTYVTDQTVTVQLHKVADVKVNGDWTDMSYTLTPKFAQSGLQLNSYEVATSADTATAASKYVLNNNIPFDDKVAAIGGSAPFDGSKTSGLEEGLYLISQVIPKAGTDGFNDLYKHEEIYMFEPFMVSLPMAVAEDERGTVGGDRVYGISPTPKYRMMKPIDLKAVKVWKDAKPSDYEKLEIQVQFIGKKDGFPNLTVDGITLNKANGWSASVYKETGHYSPKDYSWTIREAEVPEGYKETYPGGSWIKANANSESSVDTYVLTVENKKIPPKTPLIQTGQLNWPIPLLAGFGLVLMAAGVVVLKHGRKKQ